MNDEVHFFDLKGKKIRYKGKVGVVDDVATTEGRDIRILVNWDDTTIKETLTPSKICVYSKNFEILGDAFSP